MSIFSGLGALGRGLFADSKGPWGEVPDEEPRKKGGSAKPPSGAKGPWGEQRPADAPRQGGSNVSSLDEWLARSKRRFGGPGGGFGSGPSRSVYGWVALGLVALWLLFTTMHRIAPEERGVVTRLGKYSHTLSPGIGLTLPAPFDRVTKVDVQNIRNMQLGSANEETLMLTGDQNIIDIAYQVRWNIRDPELYLFELAQPDETIREVAESAMRATVAGVTLDEAIGERRGEIEARVMEVMQRILDNYRAGVSIRGIAIRQADPPAAVNEAFKDVSAAQQQAQTYINDARAYALQLTAKAQGEATAFDKVYEQYRLAPEVTRRRMYYETMEQVLKNVDKTIVEAPGVTPYLPLPQVQQTTRPQQQEQAR